MLLKFNKAWKLYTAGISNIDGIRPDCSEPYKFIYKAGSISTKTVRVLPAYCFRSDYGMALARSAILTNFVSWFVWLIITLPNQPSPKQNIHVSLGLTFAKNSIS